METQHNKPKAIERYVLDGIADTLSIYNVEGGLNDWIFGACGRKSGPTAVSDSMPSAITRVKGSLYGRHTLHLLGELPIGRR